MAKHIYADLMMQFAQDALETDSPWERWEFMNRWAGEWWSCESIPVWDSGVLYRRKPKTRTVNEFTFEWEEGDDNGYIADPLGDDFLLLADHYTDYAVMRAKERNLLAKTREMAIAHAKAMLGIDPNEEQTSSHAVRSEIHGNA